jgi:hypothetical protein
MTKIRDITVGQTFSVFKRTSRILKPDSHNSQWEEILLPYNLDPGMRVKIVSKEQEMDGEYYIVQDTYITDIGIILVRTASVSTSPRKICDKGHCMVAFNMGNSTVTLSYGDKLGYVVYVKEDT